MINRGGKKFFPREIEEILYTHPKILHAAIVGVPDSRLGERNCLCVIPRPGQTIALDEVVGDIQRFGGDVQATGDDRDLRRAPVHADREDPAPRAREARARAPRGLVFAEPDDRVTQGGDFALADPPVEPVMLLGHGLLFLLAVAPAPVQHDLHTAHARQLALEMLVEGGLLGADDEQEANSRERARGHPVEEVDGVAAADPVGLSRVVERRPLSKDGRLPFVLTPGAGDFHLPPRARAPIVPRCSMLPL